MFAESLLESGSARPKGRAWAATLSVTIQSLLLATLVALPLFRPDALPVQLRSVIAPIAYGSPEPLPATPEAGTQPSAHRSPMEEPRFIPSDPPSGNSRRPPAEATPAPCFGPCLPAGRGSPTGTVGSIPILTGFATVNPSAPAAPVKRSQMELGALVSQVQPVYPIIPQRIRLETTVVLRALIGRDGRVTSVQVLSGHALFHESAKTAVAQWRYRPYILNGQAVAVETQVTVNYRLAR